MQTYIIDSEDLLPDWLRGRPKEKAEEILDDGMRVILARRSDGQIQVIPEGSTLGGLDAGTISALMYWAASGRAPGPGPVERDCELCEGRGWDTDGYKSYGCEPCEGTGKIPPAPDRR